MDYGIKARGTKSAITMTLASLGSGSARESTEVDDSAQMYVDEMVAVSANGSGAGNTGFVDFYVYTYTVTGGSRTDGATGTDAAFTAANLKNARYLGSLQMNGTTRVFGPEWSIANAFDGLLPSRWGLIAVNRSGAALGSTGGDFTVTREPVLGTTT